MSEKGWKEIPIGGMITESGNAMEYKTGSWRTYKPVFYEDKCIHCMQCWAFCPDESIVVEDGKMISIDMDFCKGCGICAEMCPDKCSAIEMVLDEK